MPRPLSGVERLALLAVVAATALPLWLTRYLPIEDLPQHVAAIRVLHSYADPAFSLQRYFELDLFRTQYLAYYFAAHLLSFLVDVELANRLVFTLCVVGTPLALAALVGSLGRDPRLALLSLPLAYNAHLILGFANFLLGIALMFVGLTLAVQQRRQRSQARSVLLAVVALTCFYAHVVPFAFLGLGVALIALQRELRALLALLATLVPAGLAALLWTANSPAGRATVTAASGASEGPKPQFQPAAVSWADLPNWLTDVLHGERDAQLLHAFYALLALAVVVGVIAALVQRGHHVSNDAHDAHYGPDALARSLTLRLALLAPLAAALYFVAPTSYDWIWPIAQRFPLLALLFAIAILPTPPRLFGELLFAAALVLSALQTQLVAQAFHDFDQQEVGDFDRALAVIPQGQRVAGLIFDRGSRFVKFSPFIHYVAYYQARKGGAVMFTFADFPQSPFRFREHDRPPRVPARWEWMPERVRLSSIAWYDYVLVRGFAPALESARDRYTPLYRDAHYSVWKKVR